MTDRKGRARHEFIADAPNRLWLSDITEHAAAEGKLYLCAVKDVYSNRIVGYSIDSRMKSRLAVAALNSAVAFEHCAQDSRPAFWIVRLALPQGFLLSQTKCVQWYTLRLGWDATKEDT